MYNRMEHCNNGAQTCLHYCKEKHVDWQLIDKGRQFTIYSYYAKKPKTFLPYFQLLDERVVSDLIKLWIIRLEMEIIQYILFKKIKHDSWSNTRLILNLRSDKMERNYG